MNKKFLVLPLYKLEKKKIKLEFMKRSMSTYVQYMHMIVNCK